MSIFEFMSDSPYLTIGIVWGVGYTIRSAFRSMFTYKLGSSRKGDSDE